MATDPTSAIISGLQASVALDGLTISISPGMCYVPGPARILSDGTTSVVLSSPLPNTFYHLYGYDAGGGIMGLEASATPPSEPHLGTARTKQGDPTRRYLISGRTNASGVLRPGKHIWPAAMGNRIMLDAASAAGSIPLTLLSALTAVTPQTIDLSAVLPITATRATVQLQNPTNFWLFTSRSERGAPSATNYQYAAVPGSSQVVDVTLDADRKFTVLLTATGLLGPILGLLTGSVTITLVGYDYDR